jgi:hypothetical protein
MSINFDHTTDTISATGGKVIIQTASTTVLGIVKVDGTTITINNGIISAIGGSSTVSGLETNFLLMGA